MDGIGPLSLLQKSVTCLSADHLKKKIIHNHCLKLEESVCLI